MRCSPEDLSEAMDDWEGWRERVRDICAATADDNPHKHTRTHSQAHVKISTKSQRFWAVFFDCFNLFISSCYLPDDCCL